MKPKSEPDALANAIQEIKEAAAKLDGYMSIKEACIYANMSETQIRRLVKMGVLKATKNGHRYLFKRSWIDRYYEKNSNIF